MQVTPKDGWLWELSLEIYNQQKNKDMNDKEQRLSTYARRFGTDKIDHHDYIRHYAEMLPERCRSMLEIGVAKGASAQMWDAYYGYENLDLYLMDLYKDPNHVSPRWVRNHGWNPIIGDQGELNDLVKIKEQFEVIIDDGSHNAHHQLISFKHLFLNNLKGGGLYVIEDLACNEDPFYYGGDVKSFRHTPLNMLNDFIDQGHIVNPYFNYGESEVFKSLITDVKIFDAQIAFITRK